MGYLARLLVELKAHERGLATQVAQQKFDLAIQIGYEVEGSARVEHAQNIVQDLFGRRSVAQRPPDHDFKLTLHVLCNLGGEACLADPAHAKDHDQPASLEDGYNKAAETF